MPRIYWPTPSGFGSLTGTDGEPVYLIERESDHVGPRGRHSYRSVNIFLRYEWQSEGRLAYATGEAVPGQCIVRSMIAVGKTPEDADRNMAELLETKALTEIGTLSAGMHWRVNLSPAGARRLYDVDALADSYIIDRQPKDSPREKPSRLWMVGPKRGNFSAPSATVDFHAYHFPYTFAEDLTNGIDAADAIATGRLLDAGFLFPDGHYVLSAEAVRYFADLAVRGREERWDDELSALILAAYKGSTPEEAYGAWQADRAREDLDAGLELVTAKGKKGRKAGEVS